MFLLRIRDARPYRDKLVIIIPYITSENLLVKGSGKSKKFKI